MTKYPNDTIKTIMERRSIRKYKPQQITEEELKIIIDCGLNAPSARNTQAWHISIIQNADLIAWMNNEAKKNMPPEVTSRYKDRPGGLEAFDIFYGAPTLILVSGDANDSYTDSNCGYLTQNMCLAAQSIGVSSIIIGLARFMFNCSDAAKYAKELGVPDGYKPLYVVCFGYGDMDPDPPARVPGKTNRIN
jgi:nitroreductase